MRSLRILFLIVATGLAGPVLALASAHPVGGDVMLVVAAPWTDRDALILSAGGAPVGPRSAPLGSLAVSDDGDFAAALMARGAWMVLDGRLLASICGVEK